ncbi:amino acid/amide ABC transporter ATP-binding protein 2, HAAT family [Jatrophihabitans endophyticus]|uniref:Amino acid/amide ABC transporter ATP-binding protein 2, HAAT family n=1 Tax=Jatrophihabitans endophyticus TaxID=1206085 RepID=A0A1M5PRC1_9ACTN|nr:ABC transporter ATP-binding protein [Jatrophihabitans endophyticus]SHH04231.1 amino acid/amide ABC transporter ATP-binding protein 2, HAAT family [Jatrophihabitans endophyticus]
MLELDSVAAGYPGNQVLHDVTLSVGAGEVVALLGPNGAGKTTLLRAAARALVLRDGRLRLDGRDVTRSSPQAVARAGICYVPEGRGIFPALTVRDNLLLFGRGLKGNDAVDRAVEVFPFITHRLANRAGDLSGGERQMLALARAWLTRPKVVLLDEVSMGLAPLIVDDVYAFVRRIAAEGIALLIVEQYVNRIREFADRVHLLRGGRISFSGTADELGSDEEILGHYLGATLPA